VSTIYGVVTEHEREGEVLETPARFFLAPFTVVDVEKDPAYRPPGTCFMTIVFAANVSIDALGLVAGQQLSFGGDVPSDAKFSALLPFSTGPYQGFADRETERIVGDGHFFASLTEAEAWAARVTDWATVINLVPNDAEKGS
jgi:hypothetical protein